MATGINVSKAVVYAVVTPVKGIDVSKANVVAVLAPSKGIDVSKGNVYASIQEYCNARMSNVAMLVIYPVPPPSTSPIKQSIILGEKL